ncbi:hypothetical protein [Flavobacterium psychrotrophum]|uniref:hypothetical protein n=1 Tax=Flavobacterium psychrotrophum TaxID=2294119 RepID=UPI000E318BF0|nr:hypothetical protein [Flavobacterium psychrotrophum]
MKTIYIILMFAAAFIALYEQSLAKPNPYLMVGAIIVFMLGLMRLMSKVPGKNEQKDTDNEV